MHRPGKGASGKVCILFFVSSVQEVIFEGKSCRPKKKYSLLTSLMRSPKLLEKNLFKLDSEKCTRQTQRREEMRTAKHSRAVIGDAGTLGK